MRVHKITEDSILKTSSKRCPKDHKSEEECCQSNTSQQSEEGVGIKHGRTTHAIVTRVGPKQSLCHSNIISLLSSLPVITV